MNLVGQCTCNCPDTWDFTKTYKPGDSVFYKGAKYVSRSTNLNAEPSNDNSAWFDGVNCGISLPDEEDPETDPTPYDCVGVKDWSGSTTY